KRLSKYLGSSSRAAPARAEAPVSTTNRPAAEPGRDSTSWETESRPVAQVAIPSSASQPRSGQPGRSPANRASRWTVPSSSLRPSASSLNREERAAKRKAGTALRPYHGPATRAHARAAQPSERSRAARSPSARISHQSQVTNAPTSNRTVVNL